MDSPKEKERHAKNQEENQEKAFEVHRTDRVVAVCRQRSSPRTDSSLRPLHRFKGYHVVPIDVHPFEAGRS